MLFARFLSVTAAGGNTHRLTHELVDRDHHGVRNAHRHRDELAVANEQCRE